MSMMKAGRQVHMGARVTQTWTKRKPAPISLIGKKRAALEMDPGGTRGGRCMPTLPPIQPTIQQGVDLGRGRETLPPPGATRYSEMLK